MPCPQPHITTVGAVGNAITKLRDAVAGTKAESPLIDSKGNVVIAAATADFSLAYKRSAFEVSTIMTLPCMCTMGCCTWAVCCVLLKWHV